jgi:DNA-directed RNA polymerase subunit RPC12/RpoP
MVVTNPADTFLVTPTVVVGASTKKRSNMTRTFFGCSKCGYMFYVDRLLGKSDDELPEIKCPRCKASNKPVNPALEMHPCKEAECPEPKPSFWKRLILKW